MPGLLKRQESEELATSLLATALAGVTLDPPIVWADDKGTLWVIDGHHRTAALQEAGTAAKARVWVQRFEGTEAEARA